MAGIKINDAGLVDNVDNKMKLPVGTPGSNNPSALSVEQLKSHILKEVGPEVEGKILKLCGIGILAESGVTGIGDIYFDTSNNTLRKCINWRGTITSSVYETIEFYPGALYTKDTDIYSWNGSSLIKITENIVIDDTGQVPTTPGVEMYVDLSGGDGNLESILVPEAPQNGKSYIRQDGGWHEYPNASIINTKVDKESGKMLSSNDFTDEYKSKIDSIPVGGSTVYIPHVDQNGILSWTNNGTLENPSSSVIRGPKGDSGATLPGQVTITQDFGTEEGSENKVVSRKAVSEEIKRLEKLINDLKTLNNLK